MDFPGIRSFQPIFFHLSHIFLVSIVLEYNISGPVLFLQCCNCAHCFPVGLFGSEGTKRQGFGQEGLNAQKAMGECLFVTMKNSKCCGTTLKVLVFAILTQKTRGEHARHAMWSLNNSLILSIWAISHKCCGMKQGFSLVSSCFVCGFQLCHIPSFNNKFHTLIIKQMQLGADIQDKRKNPKYFDSFLWPVVHLRESTTNGLQTSKPNPVAEGNHSLVVQEAAWKDFLLLLKDSKTMAVLKLDWKASKQNIMVQVHRPSWQHCLPLEKPFLQVIPGFYSCIFE